MLTTNCKPKILFVDENKDSNTQEVSIELEINDYRNVVK